MKSTKNIWLAIFLFLGFNLNAQPKDSLDVAKATQKFVKAFNEFDWETFRGCFANDATIFFPGEFGERKTGRNEIEKSWKEIFPEFVDKTKHFDLNLIPENMIIQVYERSAVVTFQMGSGDKHLSRRTLVFVKENKMWKIVHLHASNFSRD
ncbi:MAG: DUF4440 domain-containing protein [Flavobacterium sp.]|uniref:YybH family protein n=1 Tax=Flavobacterium sp. TaxID=239 RepID=UPI0012028DAF|nr:nuclear transport factor 2 family protein [Flavobacterium sp.]RZJ65737.1 MAG: DUF4440 domain-containing protein [Flavobacterium sp.]